MRIALIHGNDGSDVRAGKTCRSLARLGHDVHFIGWDRRPHSRKELDLGPTAMHVMERATPHGRGTVPGQLAFIAHIVRSLKQIRPEVVCAVNEELAFSVLPFKGLLYDRLVCDVYDSLGPRVAASRWHKRLPLGLVHKLGLRGPDRLIATDETRRAMLGRYAHKAIVVENVPEDPGEELALRLPEGPVRIWAGGSLEEIKGLRKLLEAIEPLAGVRIVSAGWPFDEFAAEVFVKHPRVDFLGIVTARRALELAASCDAVFSYYAPINVYMVNASPNKVYDAMAVGRPVLINREVRLSDWVAQEGVGEVCAYDDVNCLRQVIARLGERRGALAAFAARARTLFRQRYQWGIMESRLAELYRGLEREIAE
jgi:glycosyltransferase involved in cell wall biosynthesis